MAFSPCTPQGLCCSRPDQRGVKLVVISNLLNNYDLKSLVGRALAVLIQRSWVQIPLEVFGLRPFTQNTKVVFFRKISIKEASVKNKLHPDLASFRVHFSGSSPLLLVGESGDPNIGAMDRAAKANLPFLQRGLLEREMFSFYPDMQIERNRSKQLLW